MSVCLSIFMLLHWGTRGTLGTLGTLGRNHVSRGLNASRRRHWVARLNRIGRTGEYIELAGSWVVAEVPPTTRPGNAPLPAHWIVVPACCSLALALAPFSRSPCSSPFPSLLPFPPVSLHWGISIPPSFFAPIQERRSVGVPELSASSIRPGISCITKLQSCRVVYIYPTTDLLTLPHLRAIDHFAPTSAHCSLPATASSRRPDRNNGLCRPTRWTIVGR